MLQIANLYNMGGVHVRGRLCAIPNWQLIEVPHKNRYGRSKARGARWENLPGCVRNHRFRRRLMKSAKWLRPTPFSDVYRGIFDNKGRSRVIMLLVLKLMG